MPLTSMMGWSLRSKNLVIFFLQSKIKVTFFFCTLMATLCHLEEHSPQMLHRALVFQEQANDCNNNKSLVKALLQTFTPAIMCKWVKISFRQTLHESLEREMTVLADAICFSTLQNSSESTCSCFSEGTDISLAIPPSTLLMPCAGSKGDFHCQGFPLDFS